MDRVAVFETADGGSIPLGGALLFAITNMVTCAERLRRYPVEVVLAGSTPVRHPNFKFSRSCKAWGGKGRLPALLPEDIFENRDKF